MASYENFYENLKEARMRLEGSIVLYDGWPYYVLTICDHKDDGILRIYLDKLGTPEGPAGSRIPGIPYEWHDEEDCLRGDRMDDFLADNPTCGIIRKMMNSPKFNKFRPFPLGMCNVGGQVSYLERSPVRHTQQGLTSSMISGFKPSYERSSDNRGYVPPLSGSALADTILGNYPSAKESFDKLLDKRVGNSSVGFHRDFAFVRGPVEGLIFLAYKQDIVGYMPSGDLSCVTLSSSFQHLKEVTEALNVFDVVV